VRRLAAPLGLALALGFPAGSASAVQATALRACGPSVCRSAGSGDLPKLPLTGKLRSSSPAPADFYWVQVSYRSGGAPTTRAYYYVPSENLLAGNAGRQPNKLEWFRVRGGAATALGDLTAALIPFKAQSRWPKSVPTSRPHTGGGSNPGVAIVVIAVVLVALALITRNRLSAARDRATPSTTDTDGSH